VEHCPSADILLRSAAGSFGDRALGIILTGMGNDGAVGVRAMRAAGSRTIAQSEESCMIFGMPREAIATECVDAVLGLEEIARQMVKFSQALCGEPKAGVADR